MTDWLIRRQRSSQEVADPEQLRKLLTELGEEGDPSLLLAHRSGEALSVAVKESLAHVEFIPASPDDPLLVASVVPAERVSRISYLEFTIGGTPTRVLRDLCVPTQTMVQIAMHYFSHKTLPGWVNWIRLEWP